MSKINTHPGTNQTIMKNNCLSFFLLISTIYLLPSCESNQTKNVKKAAVKPAIPEVTYQAPLIITKGGKYTGNYKSTDPKIPAVWVQTNDSVEITGCIIASAGEIIRCSGGTQV
ncbi:MAG: hypothetical protein WKF89_05850, partial [Chitinophagaceae bacterium]